MESFAKIANQKSAIAFIEIKGCRELQFRGWGVGGGGGGGALPQFLKRVKNLRVGGVYERALASQVFKRFLKKISNRVRKIRSF